MNAIQKIKFMTKILMINILIVPFISYLLSYTSFLILRPHFISKELTPSIQNKSYAYKCEILPDHRLFIKIIIPETSKNMKNLNFNIQTNLSKNPLFFSIKYKSNVFLFLDSIFMFFFIKLKIYDQVQVLRKEIKNFDYIKIATFEINDIKISKFVIEEVKNCGIVGMFFYEHEIFCFCCIYFVLFGLIMLVSFYLLFKLYKKCDKLDIAEVKEYLENEISESSSYEIKKKL
ncbi:hypothetical protein GVAV_003032 [Gurleya vavrai]